MPLEKKDVASDKLRAMVEELKAAGKMPPSISVEEASERFGQEGMRIISAIAHLGQTEAHLVRARSSATPGSDLWKTRMEMRRFFQEAIEKGMIVVGVISRHVVCYGAIPDPKEGWKYFLLPSQTYACWRCGADILVKHQKMSIHFAEMPLCGSGRVRWQEKPFCPNCEPEPADSGFIAEDAADAFIREVLPFAKP